MPKTLCPICGLDASTRESYESKVALGLPATAIAEYLSTLGVQVTPQQVYNHKKHSKPQGTNKSLPVPPKVVSRVSEQGLTIDDRQEKLLEIALEIVDDLLVQFRDTQNLRVAKSLKEIGEWASQLVKDRMARETIPEPNLAISIQINSLEESLGLPEPYYQPQENPDD